MAVVRVEIVLNSLGDILTSLVVVHANKPKCKGGEQAFGRIHISQSGFQQHRRGLIAVERVTRQFDYYRIPRARNADVLRRRLDRWT